MSGEIDAVREAIADNIGSFDPADRGRNEVDEFMAGLHRLYDEWGSALETVASRFHAHPAISNAVADDLHELGGVTSGVGQQAEQSYSRHKADHDTWLTD